MSQSVVVAARCALSVTLVALSLWKLVDLAAECDLWASKRKAKEKEPLYPCGFTGLVGNTPLVELKTLSDATGCRILVRNAYKESVSNGRD